LQQFRRAKSRATSLVNAKRGGGWRYLLQVLSAAVAGVVKNIRIIKIAANKLLATYQTIHYLSPNVQNWLPMVDFVFWGLFHFRR